MSQSPSPVVVESRLIDTKQVADLLGISTRSVSRLVETNRIPAPTRLGGLVRWNRAVIDTWIAASCPMPVAGAETKVS